MSEDTPPKRGRPRKYDKEGDRQKAWKDRTGFEQSEERKAYKARKAREYRAKTKSKKPDSTTEQGT